MEKFAPGSTTASATYSAGLKTPDALAIDSSGNLYVSSAGNNTVEKFAPGSTTASATYSAGVSVPYALAIDTSGNLYVANNSGNTVEKFAPGSTTASVTYSAGMNGPIALAFDSSGNLYVANQNGNTVVKFAPGSSTASVTYSVGLNEPDALAFDAGGNLYVSNYGNNTVEKFAPGSTTASVTYSAGLNHPDALAFDSSGNLYVASAYSTVIEFVPTLVSITAEDKYNNVVTGFSNSVTLSDSLGGASFGSVSFTGGKATVPATLGNTGTQTITATDSLATISGTSNPVTVTAASGMHSALASPTTNPGAAGSASASPSDISTGTITVDGTDAGASDNVDIAFTDASDFVVTVDGVATTYSTQQNQKFVYNGPAGVYSRLVFDDPSNTYTVNQSLTSTQLVSSSGFEFDLNNVTNLYVYGSSNSTATVNVASGSGSNFFVDAANSDYSYLADPITGVFSELSGFGGLNVTGSGGTTYAYIYSTSHASVVASPAGSTLTAGGVTSTFADFPQLYVIGATDGTDAVTLESAGGAFIGTPGYSYVSGTSGGNSFLFGALYCASVTAQAAGSADTAVFYSYAHDTFTGTPGSSSLTGSTANASLANYSFKVQALGYLSASVFESGTGTDVANLTSPGEGRFLSTPTASSLTVGSSTITVNTYETSGQQMAAVLSQVIVTGNHDGTDEATIYDAPGNNALTASNSTATLTTALGSLSINKFGSVTADQKNGSSDTIHEGAIDFALQTVGDWTND